MIGGLAIVGTFLILRIARADGLDARFFALNLTMAPKAASDWRSTTACSSISRYREEIAHARGRGPGRCAGRWPPRGAPSFLGALTVSAALASLRGLPSALPLLDGASAGCCVALFAARDLADRAAGAVLDSAGQPASTRSRRSFLASARPTPTRGRDHHGFWYRLSQLRACGCRAASRPPPPRLLLIALGLPFPRASTSPPSVDRAPCCRRWPAPRQVDDVLRSENSRLTTTPPSRWIDEGGGPGQAAQVYAAEARAVPGAADRGAAAAARRQGSTPIQVDLRARPARRPSTARSTVKISPSWQPPARDEHARRPSKHSADFLNLQSSLERHPAAGAGDHHRRSPWRYCS